MTAVYSGYVLSADGHAIYLYKYGASMTHQGGHQESKWMDTKSGIPNVGIELLTLRRDGANFVESLIMASQPLVE